jgi:uncharacterized protein YegL
MEQIKDFTVSSARPLPVLVLADVSGSMQQDGKIASLNHALREMLDSFRREDDFRAQIHVAVITFGGAAHVHTQLAPATQVTWSDLTASGDTPLGGAIELARNMLEDRGQIPSRAYRPTVVLVSDGQPTDGTSWETALTALLASERGAKAQRLAIGVGDDADKTVLQRFLGSPEGKVHIARDARQVREFFEFVTMSVTSRSRSAAPNIVANNTPLLDF